MLSQVLSELRDRTCVHKVIEKLQPTDLSLPAPLGESFGYAPPYGCFAFGRIQVNIVFVLNL
jgi:hypothetical protein